MRIVVQRAKRASVSAPNDYFQNIDQGLLVFLGIETSDSSSDVEWLTKKLVSLRIFDDENGVMNRSVKEIDGEILVISQFTLYARTKKGNRPSYVDAAPPDVSEPLYQSFVDHLQTLVKKEIATGVFGALMQVELINDGPVTIIIDSKNRV